MKALKFLEIRKREQAKEVEEKIGLSAVVKLFIDNGLCTESKGKELIKRRNDCMKKGRTFRGSICTLPKESPRRECWVS